jgi:cold shock CspA family protein
MVGQLVGRIIARHDRGFGFIVDETPGSSTEQTTIFFHPKYVNGRLHLSKGARVTFDLVEDLKHPDKFMAQNIDAIAAVR